MNWIVVPGGGQDRLDMLALMDDMPPTDFDWYMTILSSSTPGGPAKLSTNACSKRDALQALEFGRHLIETTWPDDGEET